MAGQEHTLGPYHGPRNETRAVRSGDRGGHPIKSTSINPLLGVCHACTWRDVSFHLYDGKCGRWSTVAEQFDFQYVRRIRNKAFKTYFCNWRSRCTAGWNAMHTFVFGSQSQESSMKKDKRDSFDSVTLLLPSFFAATMQWNYVFVEIRPLQGPLIVP